MTYEFFTEQFRYEKWATAAIMDAMEQADCPAVCHELLSHIIEAQEIWYKRINRLPLPFSVWELRSLADNRRIHAHCHTKWLEFLEEKPALDQIVGYVNMKGDSYESTIGEIVAHLLNHSTHHRGQIASHLRAAGIAPPGVDYIVYSRRAV